MQMENYDCVFVETGKGKFVPRKVEIESVEHKEVRIISGILEGENVVVEGGIYLQ
jgi:hypothetical protein